SRSDSNAASRGAYPTRRGHPRFSAQNGRHHGGYQWLIRKRSACKRQVGAHGALSRAESHPEPRRSRPVAVGGRKGGAVYAVRRSTRLRDVSVKIAQSLPAGARAAAWSALSGVTTPG